MRVPRESLGMAAAARRVYDLICLCLRSVCVRVLRAE